MNIDYEAIARNAGFVVFSSVSGWFGYHWQHEGKNRGSTDYYNTEQEAWKACCVENGLC